MTELLAATALLALWTAGWLHWMFQGHLRQFLASRLFPETWRGGRPPQDLAFMDAEEFTMFLAAECQAHPFVRGMSINRTHAYAISRTSIQAMYAHISYMQDYHSNKHIDHQLELAHQRKDWPVYCPVKWICGQRAGTSNISGKDNPDQIWQ